MHVNCINNVISKLLSFNFISCYKTILILNFLNFTTDYSVNWMGKVSFDLGLSIIHVY